MFVKLSEVTTININLVDSIKINGLNLTDIQISKGYMSVIFMANNKVIARTPAFINKNLANKIVNYIFQEIRENKNMRLIDVSEYITINKVI